MKIGIDISQIAHEGTGVATYVRNMVNSLVRKYPEHEYVLFGASLRKRHVFSNYAATFIKENLPVRLVSIPMPPTLLDVLWNRLHIAPVEWFTGHLDIFWSSDWTHPPLLHAVGVTTIHDLSILRYAEESHNTAEVDVVGGRITANIVATHTRRLMHAAKSCAVFFCDSEATKHDAHQLLGIPESKLIVVYPGLGEPTV
ncbi:MAG: glycosyltransferase [Patescibacteria group bacterium]